MIHGEVRDYSGIVRLAFLLVIIASPLTVYQLIFANYRDQDLYYIFYGADSASAIVVIVGATALYLALFNVIHREDRWLQTVLTCGLLLKVTGAALFMYMAFNVYGAAADVSHYVYSAKSLLATYQTTGTFPILQPWYNTNFVIMAAGATYAFIGPSVPGVMVFFALFSFWGQYFLYQAFVTAYPNGNRRLASVLCLLTPSLVFWTASVGKDALIAPGLGLFCYGFARMLRKPGAMPILAMASGSALILLVRPHIAAMVAIAAAITYLLGRNAVGVKGAIAKSVGIPLLIIASLYLLNTASQFTEASDFSSAKTALNRTSEANEYGGSAISQSLPVRVAYAPFLLFRPFPWEAKNLQSIAASAEGMLFLWLFWRKRRQIFVLLKTCRNDSFRFFLLVYGVEMSVTMSAAMTNLGLLARQRVMMLGPVLLFLAMPPVREAARKVSLATLMYSKSMARGV